MRKEFTFISVTLSAALALQACNPFEPPVNAHAAQIDPTVTLPQPIDNPSVISTPKQMEAPTAMPKLEPVKIVSTVEILPFPYFSQQIFKGEFTEDQTELDKVVCGMVVGGMVTRSNPRVYMKEFMDYFKSIGKWGPARITSQGSSMEDHILVLNSLGYQTNELSTEGSTMDSIKLQIKELTSKGIPVWINAKIYSRNHHTMAVGIADDGSIIFNDSQYGEGKSIPDSKIHVQDERGKIVWKVYAIYPPSK